MFLPSISRKWFAAGLSALLISLTMTASAWGVEPVTDPASYLDQTEALRTRDHPQFVERLQQLEHAASRLSPAQTWRLRYLQAWEAMYGGDYPGSAEQFQAIIRQSGDPVLVAKSEALLLGNYGVTRQYDKAFELANRLTAQLPDITDTQARAQVLLDLSQTFNMAGQSDLALKYAQLLLDTSPRPQELCSPLSYVVFALSGGHRLHSDSSELARAIDTCTIEGQPVVANALWLTKGEELLREDKAAEDLALIERIAPSIGRSEYRPHLVSSLAQRAQAHEALGHLEQARRAALAAIDASENGDSNIWLRDAYQVLYQVAKAQGDSTAALAYYEKYIAQDRTYLDDVSARSLAYQLAQQQVMARELEAEELSRQNSVLRLQRQLDAKAVETGRLYIVLLLIGFAGIALWLVRLKHSQLRFKKMASHDGLTGILNHQHFMAGSERALAQLARRNGHAALVFVDLDHFKQINDTYGHAVGDRVLRHIVQVARGHLRPDDLFGRLGGEEFGVLLVDCHHDQALSIADRVRLAVQASPLEAESGDTVPISASIGITFTGTVGYDLQALCREADAALYGAKRAGRNRVMSDVPSVSTPPPRLAEPRPA